MPEEQLQERTEEIARLIALTPTDLIMMTKRSINRQFEIMGFKTGLDASIDHMALDFLSTRFTQGDAFLDKALKEGLKSAVNWRDNAFGVGDAAGESDAAAGDEEPKGSYF